MLQSGVPVTLNLVALRQQYFVVAVNPAILTRASNHTLSARILSGGTALGRVSVYMDNGVFRYGGTAAVWVDSSQPSSTAEVSSSLNFYTLRNFLTVVYHPQNLGSTDVLAQTNSISIELTWRADLFDPPVLQPNTDAASRSLYVDFVLVSTPWYPFDPKIV
jgi:hypothetical protein